MNFYIISGRHSIKEAIKNKKRKKGKLFLTKKNCELEGLCKIHNIQIQYIELQKMNKIFDDKNFNHQNMALQITNFEPEDYKKIIKEVNEVLLLDQISDQRNIGSIIRTSVAFGVSNIFIEKKFFKNNSFYMFKAASGAIEHCNLHIVSNLKNIIRLLKKENFWIIGLSNNRSEKMNSHKWTKKNAFIFGSEGKGLKNSVEKYCDNLLEIPISKKVESLNVSNAVSAFLSYYRFKNNTNP